MAIKVAEMTQGELIEIIETTVEEKLVELLGDPDAGFPIKKSVRNRLLRQKKAVKSGKRGIPLDEVVAELGLKFKYSRRLNRI